MLRVTQRLRKISEGLVDFARVRRQQTEALALRSLIDESWSLVAIDEKASAVTFENEVGASDMVAGNGDRLVQVFVNLLRNALLAVSGRWHDSRANPNHCSAAVKTGSAARCWTMVPGFRETCCPIFSRHSSPRASMRKAPDLDSPSPKAS